MSANAWEYADYIVESSSKARLAKLRLHILEVSQALRDFTSRSGADGWSYSRASLDSYLKSLKAEFSETAPPVARPTAAFIGLR